MSPLRIPQREGYDQELGLDIEPAQLVTTRLFTARLGLLYNRARRLAQLGLLNSSSWLICLTSRIIKTQFNGEYVIHASIDPQLYKVFVKLPPQVHNHESMTMRVRDESMIAIQFNKVKINEQQLDCLSARRIRFVGNI
jgi:hypothetical protein